MRWPSAIASDARGTGRILGTERGRNGGVEPKSPATIDEYIALQPREVQAILRRIRATVRKAVPAAAETISYRMPAFVLDGHLVYFGAFKNHIGLYPPVRDLALLRETSVYAGEKGNLRFSLDEPIPYALIARIVEARVRENEKRMAAKRMRRAG